MFYVLCVIWGLADGASIANLLAFIYQFCEVRLLALLLGLNLFAEGLGALAGTQLCSKYGSLDYEQITII